jgi:hypothetical protein
MAIKPTILFASFCSVFLLATVAGGFVSYRNSSDTSAIPAICVDFQPGITSENSEAAGLKARLSTVQQCKFYVVKVGEKNCDLLFPPSAEIDSSPPSSSVSIDLTQDVIQQANSGDAKLMIVALKPGFSLFKATDLDLEQGLQIKPEELVNSVESLYQKKAAIFTQLNLPNQIVAYLPPPPPPPPPPSPRTKSPAPATSATASKTESPETSGAKQDQNVHSFPSASDSKGGNSNPISSQYGPVTDLNSAEPEKPGSNQNSESANPIPPNLTDEEIKQLNKYYAENGSN